MIHKNFNCCIYAKVINSTIFLILFLSIIFSTLLENKYEYNMYITFIVMTCFYFLAACKENNYKP